MRTNPANDGMLITRWLRNLLLAASLWTYLLVAVFVVLVSGVLVAASGSPVFLRITHAAVAAALWASLVVRVVLTGLASSVPTEESRVP